MAWLNVHILSCSKMRGRGRGRGGRFDRRRKGDDSEADGTQPKQRKIDETDLQVMLV